MKRTCLNCNSDIDNCLRAKDKGKISCCPECEHYSKHQRGMAMYELHKLINKKDIEIAKLTEALTEAYTYKRKYEELLY